MNFLEKFFFVILPAIGACISFVDIALLLKKAHHGVFIAHHEWFFRFSQFASWVRYFLPPPFFSFLLQWHVNSMLWFFQNFHWVMFWKKIVDSYHTLLKVFQWLLHFLQPDLVFLVDCKTAFGNTSFAHSISLIPGTFRFRSFLLPFCCSV